MVKNWRWSPMPIWWITIRTVTPTSTHSDRECPWSHGRKKLQVGWCIKPRKSNPHIIWYHIMRLSNPHHTNIHSHPHTNLPIPCSHSLLPFSASMLCSPSLSHSLYLAINNQYTRIEITRNSNKSSSTTVKKETAICCCYMGSPWNETLSTL